jgi:hypothetical protein
MRIAMLISGRAARYDVCLLNLLQNTTYHEIDLFMAINDENTDCEYYNVMKKKLAPYLKKCIIKKYEIPQEIFEMFNSNESISRTGTQFNLQKINNKFVPNSCLSMYYNNNLAFNMACEYADTNLFEYDCYMKFRSDITDFVIPKEIPIIKNEDLHLHCPIPPCNFISNGLFNKQIINDSISWGNRNTMKIYCNTYNYTIEKIKEYNGKYFVAGECSLTDNIYENNLFHTFYNIPYSLEKNRRMFDKIYDDSRTPVQKQTHILNINDENSLEYIPPEDQDFKY